jgi:hypothetical protein
LDLRRQAEAKIYMHRAVLPWIPLVVALCACGAGDGAREPAPAISWGAGDRAVSGRAWFFDMQVPGELITEENVQGAVVYVLEAPELRATLDSAHGYAFRFDGIPDGVNVTLALAHPDHFPTLTATLPVSGADLEGVTFQAVSWRIAALLAGLLGQDASDPELCQMVTTVSAPGAVDVWAPGEPGATVTIDPPVPAKSGPVYFNPSVIPDRKLSATSTDGGVIVAGVEPGVYRWTGHKEGVAFDELEMKCVGGWLTNASPPWGMNVTPGG